KENPYSNFEPICVDISPSEPKEHYLDVSKIPNPFVGGNRSAFMKEPHPIYYELDTTKNNPDSEKQAIGNIGGAPGTAILKNVYSKLGDQSRHFNNPYNYLSGTGDSVTASNLDVSAVIE
ncbi:unnamed protein product, partial [Lymnaea stagnalis]